MRSLENDHLFEACESKNNISNVPKDERYGSVLAHWALDSVCCRFQTLQGIPNTVGCCSEDPLRATKVLVVERSRTPP